MKQILLLAGLLIAAHICGQETKQDSLNYRQAVYYQDVASNKILDGDKQGALGDFTKAIELYSKDPISYYNRANLKVSMGDRQGALADYTKAIDLKPDYVNSYLNRATLKVDQGDEQGALADYAKVIELKPDYVAAYAARGEMFDLVGNKDKALTDYLKAEELSGGLFREEDSALFSNIARIYYERKNFKTAIAYYTKGIEVSKSNGNLYCSRGLAKQRLGKDKAACEDWSIANLLGTPQAAGLLKEFCKKKR